MEMKQYISLESLKNDFKFIFHMPNGASWGNALDAAFEILQKLNELSQQSIKAANPNAAPVDQPEADEDMEVQGD